MEGKQPDLNVTSGTAKGETSAFRILVLSYFSLFEYPRRSLIKQYSALYFVPAKASTSLYTYLPLLSPTLDVYIWFPFISHYQKTKIGYSQKAQKKI